MLKDKMDLVMLSADIPYDIDLTHWPTTAVPILRWPPRMPIQEHDYLGIIYLQNCDSGPTFNVIDTEEDVDKGCHDVKHPDMEYTTNNNQGDFNSTDDVLVNIVASLILRLKWTSTFILTDSINGKICWNISGAHPQDFSTSATKVSFTLH